MDTRVREYDGIGRIVGGGFFGSASAAGGWDGGGWIPAFAGMTVRVNCVSSGFSRESLRTLESAWHGGLWLGGTLAVAGAWWGVPQTVGRPEILPQLVVSQDRLCYTVPTLHGGQRRTINRKGGLGMFLLLWGFLLFWWMVWNVFYAGLYPF
jgi:hypothetical protein